MCCLLRAYRATSSICVASGRTDSGHLMRGYTQQRTWRRDDAADDNKRTARPRTTCERTTGGHCCSSNVEHKSGTYETIALITIQKLTAFVVRSFVQYYGRNLSNILWIIVCYYVFIFHIFIQLYVLFKELQFLILTVMAIKTRLT